MTAKIGHTQIRSLSSGKKHRNIHFSSFVVRCFCMGYLHSYGAWNVLKLIDLYLKLVDKLQIQFH